MEKTSVCIILIIITLGAISSTVLALLASKTIHSTGTIKAVRVGVYKESSCGTPVSSLEWNDMVPGENRTITIYVRNEGTVEVLLRARAENWNPGTASTYIKFSWNRDNYKISAGSVVQATLTLFVSENVSGFQSFSFDIVITGETS